MMRYHELHAAGRAALGQGEVDGERLTWTVRAKETHVTTLDRVPALRTLMAEYRHVFERMRVLNPSCTSDYDVSLAYMSNFKAL